MVCEGMADQHPDLRIQTQKLPNGLLVYNPSDSDASKGCIQPVSSAIMKSARKLNRYIM